MGWFGDILKGIVGEPPPNFIYIEDLPFPNLDTTQEIKPNKHYVTLRVEAARIEKGRAFTERFHGVVYSFATLVHQGEADATIPAISKPKNLAELDADSIGNVITVSKEMMGTVPWRGDTFGLELGLFSVRSGDLLTPIVNFVTKVSDTAGISFVGAVKPFVPLITQGMQLLTGQTKDVKLQVGVDTNIDVTHPMACAIIAAQPGQIRKEDLVVDGAGKLFYKNAPLDKGYCVFTIRSATEKPDFGEIPELKDAYAALITAAKKGDDKVAEEALIAFKRAAVLSPDLIQDDADRLADMAQGLFDRAFPKPALGGQPAIPLGVGDALPERLAELPLYEV